MCLFVHQARIPGSRALSTDVAVPLSKLTDVIVETQADLKEAGLYGNIVGYVCDFCVQAVRCVSLRVIVPQQQARR